MKIKFEAILHKPWLRAKATRQSMCGLGVDAREESGLHFDGFQNVYQNLFQVVINGLIEKKVRGNLDLSPRPLPLPSS